MKVHIKIEQGDIKIEQIAEGTPEKIVQEARRQVANRLPFFQRAAVKSMPLSRFMAEVVRRYNSKFNTAYCLPATPEQFIDWAVQIKQAEIIER